MKRFVLCLLAMSFLLGGCKVFSGSYYSATPHQNQSQQGEAEVISVYRYAELQDALVELAHSGTESRVINVPDYDSEKLEEDLQRAIAYVQEQDAIGAYAVEQISYELGTSGFVPAVAVKISYLRNWEELRKIQNAKDMEDVWNKIQSALLSCNAGIVLLVESYAETDLIQMVEDCSQANPDTVMEIPEVTMEVYPDSGSQRVINLKFTYQNSRTDLRQMQAQVSSVFRSAKLYVSDSSSDARKYSRLYAFLMERFDSYQVKTSITPTYSLLHHGVGDSRAFATVYARMCEMAGLECKVVTGTRQGEPWSWNLVLDDGIYYHVDLLRCSEMGTFQMQTDRQMEDYVWDYSAYSDETVEAEEPTETATEIAAENILK